MAVNPISISAEASVSGSDIRIVETPFGAQDAQTAASSQEINHFQLKSSDHFCGFILLLVVVHNYV